MKGYYKLHPDKNKANRVIESDVQLIQQCPDDCYKQKCLSYCLCGTISQKRPCHVWSTQLAERCECVEVSNEMATSSDTCSTEKTASQNTDTLWIGGRSQV